MRRLPGVSVLDGSGVVEPIVGSDPPVLRAATVIEGASLRAVRVPDFSLEAKSGFGAFLDGTQKVQIVAHHRGMPIVIGTVSGAVRVRVDRRMTTWAHQRPIVARKIYLPLRYLPALAHLAADAAQSSWQIVDTSTADKNGEYPSQHPAALLERATRAVDQEREQLEDRLAEAWCERGTSPIFIDGGISRSASVASSPLAVGVIKSHRTLYVEDDALPIVLGLRKGERSSVFRVSPRSRNSVMSWYLRMRGGEGRDPLWGLVRVEVAERDRPSDRANEISRWIMAETTPLSLPDGRWDKLAYGVRDCEEFLRAIS
ncbi:MAG: hypothetical protein M3037_10385 [Gemmatimonadota bacterium]|nr:hypothetical protein [Gemmatimonadota bacterium]